MTPPAESPVGLVEWLRDVTSCGCVEPERFKEAADTIESLQAELERAVAMVTGADKALANVTAFESDARYIMGNTNFEIVQQWRDQARSFIASRRGE